MDFSDLLDGFVKIDTLISLSCYVELSKWLHTWICWICYVDLSKLFLYIFLALLPNKTKLKFDQDFKVCWSFWFELKVFNVSKYSIPWVRFAFRNVWCLIFISPSALDAFVGIKSTCYGKEALSLHKQEYQDLALRHYQLILYYQHVHTSLKLALLSPSLIGTFLKMIIMIIVIMMITNPVFQYSICFHPRNGKELLFPCISQHNLNNIPFTISESKH